jgi:hypothetical protein
MDILMTLSEFNAWLDGFMHGKESPSPDEWKLIAEKLAGVREASPAAPVIAPIYPRYYDTTGPHWQPPITITSTC